jgi:hypothetical protein
MSRVSLYRTAAKALPYQELGRMIPMLLSPVALIAAVMAFWRFGADAGWTDTFVVSNGFLSHWQVWLGIAAGIQWISSRLDQRVKRG